MPKLPDLGENQLPTPKASTAIVGYEANAPGMDAMGKAAVATGQALSDIGHMVTVWQDRRDTVAAEDAFNKIREAQIELSSGEKGYANVKGANAVNQPLLENYTSQIDKRIEDVSGTLSSAKAKEKFKQRADVARLQFREGVMRHVLQEDETHSKEVYAGTIAVEEKAAMQNWDKPAEVALSLERVRNSVKEMADRNGWPEELAKAEEQKQISRLHESVITSMIAQGHDLDAATYFNAIKDDLSADSAGRMEPKIRSATTDGKAFRGTDEIWQALGPRGTNDPVRLFDMEAKAREMFRDDPYAQKAAIAEIRSRAQGFNAQQVEVNASNHAKVLDAYTKGTSLMNIKKMPEYQALSGTEQAQITEHIIDRGYTLAQRAKADRNSENNDKGWTTYWEMTKDYNKLKNTSEAEIIKLAPEIGWPITNKLLEHKRSQDKSLTAQVDGDMFNRAMQDAGFDPYSKNQRPTMGRMRDHVESVIAAEQQGIGRVLNRDEKEKLMQREIDKKVVEEHWYGNTETPAGMVPPDKRKNIIMPIAQIPETQITGMLNVMRSRGRIASTMTDEEARRKFSGSIEKAYGRYVAKGSQQEVLDALDGK